MDQLFHHIMSDIYVGKNLNLKRKRISDIRKTKNDNKELKEDKFEKLSTPTITQNIQGKIGKEMNAKIVNTIITHGVQNQNDPSKGSS